MPRVTLWLRKRTEGMARIRVKARWSKPLRSVFQTYCRRLGLQESQVPLFCGELLSTTLQTSSGSRTTTSSRLMRCTRRRRTTKAWTRSMGLGLVFPLGSCPCGCAGGSAPGTAGRVGVHVRSQCERTALPSSWSRALTTSTALVPHPFVVDQFLLGSCRACRRARLWHVHAWYCCFLHSLFVSFGRRQAKVAGLMAGTRRKSCSAKDRIQSWFDSGYLEAFCGISTAPCICSRLFDAVRA